MAKINLYRVQVTVKIPHADSRACQDINAAIKMFCNSDIGRDYSAVNPNSSITDLYQYVVMSVFSEAKRIEAIAKELTNMLKASLLTHAGYDASVCKVSIAIVTHVTDIWE